MTRRPLSYATIIEVDTLVARLDAQAIDEPLIGPATSGFGAIMDAWERFKALVALLDVAVNAPLSKRAPSLFKRAPKLIDEDAHRLAFWLSHVGEAVTRRRQATNDPQGP